MMMKKPLISSRSLFKFTFIWKTTKGSLCKRTKIPESLQLDPCFKNLKVTHKLREFTTSSCSVATLWWPQSLLKVKRKEMYTCHQEIGLTFSTALRQVSLHLKSVKDNGSRRNLLLVVNPLFSLPRTSTINLNQRWWNQEFRIFKILILSNNDAILMSLI